MWFRFSVATQTLMTDDGFTFSPQKGAPQMHLAYSGTGPMSDIVLSFFRCCEMPQWRKNVGQ